ncbi:hypothetical protein [Brevibacterium album]|uniref:hypothetical protein n=1 Tax=Brevibacterium album TaxID=417948 RepID=UPI00040333E6|nr:hypothetical protein [Brevibacterium album]
MAQNPRSPRPPQDEQRREDAAPEQAQAAEIDEALASASTDREHDDALADEWGEESFPGSDPPANY